MYYRFYLGYRYRRVLFAPSDTRELVFAFLRERRSARKYCSNDGFLEGMARSWHGEGNRATWKNDRRWIRREREDLGNLMRGQIVKHEIWWQSTTSENRTIASGMNDFAAWSPEFASVLLSLFPLFVPVHGWSRFYFHRCFSFLFPFFAFFIF